MGYDILKWADTAMYQAKKAGRNLVRFFYEGISVVAALNDMLRQSGLVKTRAAKHARQFKSSATQKEWLL